MVIACVSDTHLPAGRSLPETLLAALRDLRPDHILHAGDLVDGGVLEQLEGIAPTTAVAGNLDPGYLVARLGRTRLLDLAGVTVGLTHGDRGIGTSTADRAASLSPEAAVVVFGHSHQPLCERRGVRLLLNPGSPTQPRMARHPSFGVLRIGEEGRVEGEIVRL